MAVKLYNGVRLLGSGPSVANVSRIDAGAIPMILAMAKTGLQVDLDHFAKMEKSLVEDMDRIREQVHTLTGHYINLPSGDQVSDLLFKKLGLKQARFKLTRSGDREAWKMKYSRLYNMTMKLYHLFFPIKSTTSFSEPISNPCLLLLDVVKVTCGECSPTSQLQEYHLEGCHANNLTYLLCPHVQIEAVRYVEDSSQNPVGLLSLSMSPK